MSLSFCSSSAAKESPVLTHKIPGDIHIRVEGQDSFSQADFDKYSWDTFLAINWPASLNGTPIIDKLPGEDGNQRTIWSSWKRDYEVFLPKGKRPGSWGDSPHVPELYATAKVKLGDESFRSFKRLLKHAESETIGQFEILNKGAEASEVFEAIDVAKAIQDRSLFLTSSIAKGNFSTPHKGYQTEQDAFQTEQAFNNGPLVDRQGHYVRLEILINRQMFEYILNNGLYSVEGQKRFSENGHNLSFPCGMFKLDANGNPEWDNTLGRPKTEAVGSIMLKAAWKILTDDEISSGRFHMRGGVLCTPHTEQANGAGEHDHISCAVLGLVGLHIVHKSENMPQWVWSTFEHVDNCPDKVKESPEYSFYEPRSHLSVNHKLPLPWAALYPDNPEPVTRRSKVVRATPIALGTQAVNQLYQQQLKSINQSNVWQYYQLVSAQWPSRPARALADRTDPDHCNALKLAPADLLGNPTPTFLANTTMETFIQGKVPNVSSSCMECHANATSKNGKFSDFTYLLIRAKGAK